VPVETRPDSVEFKVMLDPSRFENTNKGLEKFYQKLKAAADAADVPLRRTGLNTVQRETSFLDTADFALKKKGYILRQRLESKHDAVVMLKFRDTDAARASAAEVLVGDGYQAKSKLEKDRTGEGRSVFSKSSKINLKKAPKGSIQDFAKMFPTLTKLGLDPNTPLQTVHDKRVQEERYQLGEVKVGGSGNAPAYLTLWYEEDKPAIAEFSFAIQGTAGEAQGENLMKHLAELASKWVGQGSTKTEFIYDSPSPP
jgi:hypothetical protein